MKYVLLLIVLSANHTLGQFTVLSFKVKDSLKRQITFFEPIEGHANRSVPTYRIENDNGNEKIFERRIKISKPVAIEVHFGYEPLWLYVEPGKNIQIHINLNLFKNNGTNGGLTIRGPNGKGDEYFNSFNFQPSEKFKLTDNILASADLESPVKTLKIFKQKIDSSFNYLRKLKNEKLISSVFYKLVTGDLSLSYLGEFGKGLLRSKTSITNKCKIMDALYKIYDPENEQNLQGFFNEPYYYQYGIYKNTSSGNSGLLCKDTTLRFGDSDYTIEKNFIPFIYLKGEVMKFEWGMALYKYKTFFPERFAQTDVAPYFAQFPDSWLHRFLNSNTGNKYNKTVSNFAPLLDSTRIIILNADSLRSLKEVLNGFFKNRLVYVDFWATWCLPCKEEFSFNRFVDSFCIKNNIARLYVSFDLPADRLKVLKNIYSFKLYGSHLLLNKYLFNDIINKIYNGSSRYSIPRYLIIDKKSKIVEKNAERPSSGNALLDQLKLYIDH